MSAARVAVVCCCAHVCTVKASAVHKIEVTPNAAIKRNDHRSVTGSTHQNPASPSKATVDNWITASPARSERGA